MVQRFIPRKMSAEEELKCKIDFCKNCQFYECEFVEEYVQFRKNHPSNHKSQKVTVTAEKTNVERQTMDDVLCISDDVVTVTIEDDHEEMPSFLYDQEGESGGCIVTVDDSGKKLSVSYDQEGESEKGCFIYQRYVEKLECGRQKVTEGIGDHYKIETDWEHEINKETNDRWEPSQAVVISAQTGQGKNYFIENALVPYVRELNYKNKTQQKVLILSNRLALKQQIENRLNGKNIDSDDEEEERCYPYMEYTDVMTYQSLLRLEKKLKSRQKKAESRYIYVICDEAHFFTSDAMFNPHTQKILSLIIRLFQDAVRVYMSATPYECLQYLFKYGEKSILFYHFKRDYSYLDIKAYSLMDELYEEIVESVNQRKEKWLIFIDDKAKCKTVKEKLEKVAEDKNSPLFSEATESEKKVEKVFAVDADSKRNPIYQEIVKREMLGKDTYVLISTSVLDNGVNLKDINNIIVSDMLKVKCLQMAGRARVGGVDDRKTLYVKRFGVDEVEKRIADLMRHQDAYHSYELAYEQEEPSASKNYNVYNFFNKYYNGKSCDWEDAKHWFGKPMEEPTKLYINEIAKSLLDKQFSCYQFIRDEMVVESYKGDKMQGDSRIGQKYLEHQFSCFGKKYCLDDDITFADKEKARKEFIDFLESYVESGEQIVDTGEESQFRKKFTKLCDAALGRKERNLKRIYHISKMNKLLKENHIDYKVDSKSSYWIVEKCNWEIEDIE